MSRERDMDTIRDLMLEIVGGKRSYCVLSAEAASILGTESDLSREDADKLELHLKLLQDAGFVTFRRSGGGYWFPEEITWKGQDFADTIRDPAIWKATKEGVKKAGGFSVDLMVALGKGLIKKQVERVTGVEVDL